MEIYPTVQSVLKYAYRMLDRRLAQSIHNVCGSSWPMACNALQIFAQLFSECTALFLSRITYSI